MRLYRHSIFVVLLCLSGVLSAQDDGIKVLFRMMEKKTMEPIVYGSVQIKGTFTGILADENGVVFLGGLKKTDTLILSAIGYKMIVVPAIKYAGKDTVNIFLEMDDLSLEEIIIKAPKKVKEKDTLALRIARGVIANKDINRPRAFDNYQYEEYQKTEAALFNVDPSLKNRKILKPFRFVFENEDSTADGRRFIPLILKEQLSQHYFRSPADQKMVILAEKISGIESPNIKELLDYTFSETDIYKNQILINEKPFITPFADGGPIIYNYFFSDSIRNNDSTWTYRIYFSPKSKTDLAFKGWAWIYAPSYAIQRMQIEIDRRANLNFVSEFFLEQGFVHASESGWFKNYEVQTTNISITKRKKSKSVRLKRTTSRKDVLVNDTQIPDSLFAGEKVVYLKDFTRRDNDFWGFSRHDSLSVSESQVYGLIDSLKRTRAYKMYSWTGRLFATGYAKVGKFDLGNMYQMVSWNDIEGVRLRMGFRSRRELTERVGFNVYGAYGTQDKRFKYGGEVWVALKQPNFRRQRIGLAYRDDYQRFALNANQSNYDFIYNSIVRKNAISDLVYIRDLKLFYQKEFPASVYTDWSFNYERYRTIPGKIEFTKTNEDESVTVINDFIIVSPRLQIRYTPGARIIEGAFKERYLKGRMPRLFLTYDFSQKGFFKSDFSFHRLDFTMQQRIPGPIGWTRYQFTANKLFGKAPYPLLTIHPGNESFLIERDRYGMLEELEYLSDQHLMLILEHHFDGFFFNKIPLWNKLQLREVFITKMIYGSLRPDNVSLMDIPAGLKGLNGYYAEIGFGIENIARLFRVDFMWRLTQKDREDARNFRVQFNISPNF
jgi:hypothetical protein